MGSLLRAAQEVWSALDLFKKELKQCSSQTAPGVPSPSPGSCFLSWGSHDPNLTGSGLTLDFPHHWRLAWGSTHCLIPNALSRPDDGPRLLTTSQLTPALASHYGLCLTIGTLGWTPLLVISHPQEEALEALLRSLVFFWTVLHVGRIFSPYRPSALKPAPPAQSPCGQPRTDACTAGNHTWSSWPFGLWPPSYKPGSTIQLEHTPVCPSQVTCPSWAARF